MFPQVWKEWGITKLCFEVDTEPYAKERDAKIRKLASDLGQWTSLPQDDNFPGFKLVQANQHSLSLV